MTIRNDSMMVVIREIQPSEYPLLEDFLYEAIFIPDGVTPPPRSIVQEPELQVYVSRFGEKKDDRALVAEADGKVVGAVWTRIMPDYGHIDDATPSLAISLYKAYRGRGIGTALLQAMLSLLKESGYTRTSLSVQKANDAVRLYQRAGYEVIEENAEEYIMVKYL